MVGCDDPDEVQLHLNDIRQVKTLEELKRVEVRCCSHRQSTDPRLYRSVDKKRAKLKKEAEDKKRREEAEAKKRAAEEEAKRKADDDAKRTAEEERKEKEGEKKERDDLDKTNDLLKGLNDDGNRKKSDELDKINLNPVPTYFDLPQNPSSPDPGGTNIDPGYSPDPGYSSYP